MDDILLLDSNKEGHLKHLTMIFKQIRRTAFKLKLSECAFFKKHLHYFGHFLSGEGIYPFRKKVESIANLASPTDTTKTTLDIGLVTCYEHISDIVGPLTDLTRKVPISL